MLDPAVSVVLPDRKAMVCCLFFGVVIVAAVAVLVVEAGLAAVAGTVEVIPFPFVLCLRGFGKLGVRFHVLPPPPGGLSRRLCCVRQPWTGTDWVPPSGCRYVTTCLSRPANLQLFSV